ncbi:MAG: cysteine desulfurase family protein [Acidimicrobiales bacterium]|jgi:cysteine desulfurase
MEAYLDHAASTPARPEVIDAMVPWLADHPGNPSGAHKSAREARRAIDDVRDLVAELVGGDPGDVVFTSGGTEADNLAVDGVLGATGGLAVCSATEHPAVLEPVQESGGLIAPTDKAGRVDLTTLAEILDAVDDVALVSVMLANNETGVINPVAEVAALVAEKSSTTVVHTDAVQATAWIDLATHCAGAHLISLTGHKIGGPKGAGALVVKKGTPLRPVLRGGGQERERRSGTQNVPAIAGLGAALRLAMDERAALTARVGALRDRLETGLLSAVENTICSLPTGTERTPLVAHLCFGGIASESLLFLLEQEGIAASAASSCASGAQEPSHVLAAMGVDRQVAEGALRLSLGWTTTEAEIDHALEVIPPAVARLREYA